MPTKEWFRENPKVTGYISHDLYSKLNSYMRVKGIKKVSQAITIILEEKFNVQKSSNPSELEKKLDALEANMAQYELLMKQKFEDIFTALNKVTLEEKYSQLTLDETLEENKSKKEYSKVTRSSPTSKRLTTKEVEDLTGISRQKLEYKRKTGKLPYSIKGYTIIRWIEKEHKPPHSNVWEVQEASPS